MFKLDTRKLRLLSVALGLSLVAAACGGDNDNGGSNGGEDLSGSITISGSSTVEPISVAVSEKFSGDNSGVAIDVSGPGTSDGFELFCNGETDVSDASRAIEQEEIDACAENGIDFIELKVGIDGLSVITSSENDQVDCLSFLDLWALLGPESQGFDNWSDANDLAQKIGAENAPYPDVPLEVTAPGEESGTFDSFVELVLESAAEEVGFPEEEIAPRPDYQASANDTVIIEGVSGTPTSLGWVGYAFYVANQQTVRALPITGLDGGSECVEPNPETISSGDYPIARDLYIYVNQQKLQESPALEAFVDFYVSDEGIASVSEVGYVDLADGDLQATRDAWEAKETGTREG